MRRLMLVFAVAIIAAMLGTGLTMAALRDPTQPIDKRSGFYDFATFQETLASGTTGPGRGTIAGIVCVSDTATQPAVFNGNLLLNCDSEGPHNETTIAINPKNPDNVIGGSHSYLLEQVGSTVNAHVIAAAFASNDGGKTWTNVHPPLGSYQFTGDPVLAFDGDGRTYYFNIADHEGQGGAFTNVSVIAQRSDDAGLTWTDPVTVAQGQGAVAGVLGVVVFNDKEWGTADAGASSLFKNNVYVTWTRFLFLQNRYIESPIFFSKSTDGGQTWSAPKEISGHNAALCSAQLDTTGGTDRCDEDQFSQPVVAPDGTLYVSFENEQRVGDGQFRDQVLVVKSTDGGETWSNPVAATPLIHDGASDYPINVDGRQTLTGCQFRTNSSGALAVSPFDSRRLYYVYTENKTPGTSTQTDIMVVASGDGGTTWSSPVTVNSSRKDQVYPWAAVGPDGLLRVGYFDRDRSVPAGQSCVYGFTLSTARDLTAQRFSHRAVESALSIASDSRWFGRNTRFIGDYSNIAVASDGTVYSHWTDMRQTKTIFGRTGKDQDAVVARTR